MNQEVWGAGEVLINVINAEIWVDHESQTILNLKEVSG